MIGIGWATLYSTMIQKYEKESKTETHLQFCCCNNLNK
jgi:hypothetical protein